MTESCCQPGPSGSGAPNSISRPRVLTFGFNKPDLEFRRNLRECWAPLNSYSFEVYQSLNKLRLGGIGQMKQGEGLKLTDQFFEGAFAYQVKNASIETRFNTRKILKLYTGYDKKPFLAEVNVVVPTENPQEYRGFASIVLARDNWDIGLKAEHKWDWDFAHKASIQFGMLRVGYLGRYSAQTLYRVHGYFTTYLTKNFIASVQAKVEPPTKNFQVNKVTVGTLYTSNNNTYVNKISFKPNQFNLNDIKFVNSTAYKFLDNLEVKFKVKNNVGTFGIRLNLLENLELQFTTKSELTLQGLQSAHPFGVRAIYRSLDA